jgi:NAD(P)-dependent dehydrogenase (short-subunit alcohol dehydrogenase family)
MTYDFSEKVVAVTGASGIGIGKEIARQFFQAGAKVSICSRSKEHIEKTKEEIASSDPDRMLAVAANMMEVEGARYFIHETVAHFGKIDVLVNNAGVNKRGPSLDVAKEDWDYVVNTKMRGYFFCAQSAAADMIQRREPGNIVNISSANAQICTIGSAVYAATNAAVVQMTKSLAREWGPNGIRVNAIGPGSIPTLMNQDKYSDPAVVKALCDSLPLRRRGRTDEIAAVVLFLASEQSSYITGQTIFADGGLTLCIG